MAQYVLDVPDLAMILDFVDVDSAKWHAYGERHAWPMSWIYRREGERLLAVRAEGGRREHARRSS